MKTKTEDDSIRIIEKDCMTQQRSLSLNTITSVSNKATEDDTKSVLTFRLCFCLIICISGSSFQVGWSLGVLNTSISAFREFYNNTNILIHSKPLTELEWDGLWALTNSLLPLGAMVGALCSGAFADKFGRLKALLMINSLVFTSVFISISSVSLKSIVPFIVARFITGITCGLFSGVATMYLSEIAPRSLRGSCSTLYQLAYAIGVLVSNICGLPQFFGTLEKWPFLYGITLIPALVHVCFLPFCVETPKFMFLNRNKSDEAEIILEKIRGYNNRSSIQRELEELEIERVAQANHDQVTNKDLFLKPIFFRPLIVAAVIQLSQQASGSSAISLYSTDIFVRIGFDAKTWAVYGTLAVNSCKIVMTFVCTLLIERTGRRFLLLCGFAGMGVSSILLTFVPVLLPNTTYWLEYLSIFATTMYVIFYSIGPGPIAWVITGELFSSQARGKATSISILVHWIANFSVSVSVPLMVQALNSYMWLIFAGLIVLFWIFVYVKVPETKNRTNEEISAFFKI